MASNSIDSLVDALRPFAAAFLDRLDAAGLQPRISSARRSHSEQKRLYSSALAGNNAFPVAKPGYSAHEYGEAFDLIVTPYDLRTFKQLGRLWKSWHGGWGGAFHDPIHFELPGASARAAALGRVYEAHESNSLISLPRRLLQFYADYFTTSADVTPTTEQLEVLRRVTSNL